MQAEWVVIIGIGCTILGTLLGYLNWNRNRDCDIKKDAVSDGELKADISYIRQGVEDIRVDMRVQQSHTEELRERVTRVEESTKQAHRRIDDLDK